MNAQAILDAPAAPPSAIRNPQSAICPISPIARTVLEQLAARLDRQADGIERTAEAVAAQQGEPTVAGMRSVIAQLRSEAYAVRELLQAVPEVATPPAEKRCDHKFIDSTHCLKCGWTPPSRDSALTSALGGPRP